MSKEKP